MPFRSINDQTIFGFFAILSFVLSFFLIVFFLNYSILPIIFVILGAVSYYFDTKKSIYLYIFLLPITGAVPWFSKNGYSFNLMAIALFYLSGMIISSILKGEKYNFEDRWMKYYKWFLLILWISAVFVFLRWSNLLLSFSAFLKDTQVSPKGGRISFAVIFPVMTLSLFSVSHYLQLLIKKNKLCENKVMFYLSTGFFLSVILSIVQKFGKLDFMSAPIPDFWKDKPSQFNGGFSDFNGYGFFAGVLFLYFFINLIGMFSDFRKKRSSFLYSVTGIIFSLLGIILSGSRTALIFVIFGFFYLLFFKKIKIKVKLIFIVFALIVIVLFGGTVRDRLIGSFSKLSGSQNFLTSLDKASNGRITMIRNSIPIITSFPVSGIGSGNFLFYLQYIKHGEDYYEDLPLNQYLLILTELGILGLFFFLLFLSIIVINHRKNKFFFVLLAIITALFFGNSFWLPEVLLLFWILSAFSTEKVHENLVIFKKENYFFVFLLACFVISNVFSFSQLSPQNLLQESQKIYKFGFFDESGKKEFLWTKDSAGIYIKLDKNGNSNRIKIFCGAPVHKLENKKQVVTVFWKGAVYKEIVFDRNVESFIRIKGIAEDEGFIEIKISPTFNLKKMGLGEETRDLGVQFFFDNFKNEL